MTSIEEIPIDTTSNQKRKYTPEELKAIRSKQGRELAERRRNGEFNKTLGTWRQISKAAHTYGLKMSEGGVKKSKTQLRKEIMALKSIKGEDISDIKEAWGF